MTDLDKRVFGKITKKEIIGADPPAIPDTKNLLEKEFEFLLSQLESNRITSYNVCYTKLLREIPAVGHAAVIARHRSGCKGRLNAAGDRRF